MQVVDDDCAVLRVEKRQCCALPHCYKDNLPGRVCSADNAAYRCPKAGFHTFRRNTPRKFCMHVVDFCYAVLFTECACLFGLCRVYVFLRTAQRTNPGTLALLEVC